MERKQEKERETFRKQNQQVLVSGGAVFNPPPFVPFVPFVLFALFALVVGEINCGPLTGQGRADPG